MSEFESEKWVEHHFNMHVSNDRTQREFGVSYIQRQRRISFNQAKMVLTMALEKGVLEVACEGRYKFKQIS